MFLNLNPTEVTLASTWVWNLQSVGKLLLLPGSCVFLSFFFMKPFSVMKVSADKRTSFFLSFSHKIFNHTVNCCSAGSLWKPQCTGNHSCKLLCDAELFHVNEQQFGTSKGSLGCATGVDVLLHWSNIGANVDKKCNSFYQMDRDVPTIFRKYDCMRFKNSFVSAVDLKRLNRSGQIQQSSIYQSGYWLMVCQHKIYYCHLQT